MNEFLQLGLTDFSLWTRWRCAISLLSMVDGTENNMIVFGQNLRNIRKSKSLSMEELANIADMELAQIHRIETGKTNPKLSTIFALAKALEVSPKEFFFKMFKF